jgi:hypothetical protein
MYYLNTQRVYVVHVLCSRPKDGPPLSFTELISVLAHRRYCGKTILKEHAAYRFFPRQRLLSSAILSQTHFQSGNRNHEMRHVDHVAEDLAGTIYGQNCLLPLLIFGPWLEGTPPRARRALSNLANWNSAY